jgi:anti-sigma factor RsiW
MIHVDEGMLLAYLDEEAGAQRREVAEHLVACPTCAAELQAFRDMTADVHAALALGDVTVPIEAGRARLDRARHEAGRGIWRRAVHLGPYRVGVLQAAVLALLLAGVAGAAIPGSPFRLWLESALRGDDAPVPAPVVPAPTGTAPSTATAPDAPAAEPMETRVQAVDGRVLIVLRQPPASARLIVLLADADLATVEANATTVTRGPGFLRVEGFADDEIVVTLPATVRSAMIQADGQLLVHREGDAFSYLPDNAVRTGDRIIIPLQK